MSTAGSDPLQILAAAVSPVVLVSATAILISGSNSRYISIADRMRALAHEFREATSTPERKTTISREIVSFQRRIQLVAWAVRALYAAVGCFITVVIIISASSRHQTLSAATLPLFALGTTLIMTAIVCQLLELQISHRTICLEISDVLVTRLNDAAVCGLANGEEPRTAQAQPGKV
jgi:hypothetical protein